MQEIHAPNLFPQRGIRNPVLFLAGSIEMGVAEEWQKRVTDMLRDTDWIILNPRRDDWDSSWEQSIHNEKFRQQVEWELSALDRANKIIMYFSPETKSPISLLELGLHAREKKMVVVCPEGFWRKGNVDIVCARYDIRQEQSLEYAVEYIRKQQGWENV